MKHVAHSKARSSIRILVAAGFASICVATSLAHGATLVSSGGKFGTQLSAPGIWIGTPSDIDGDGTADLSFVNGSGTGYLDASGVYGLVGNIGSSGAAWVRNTSVDVTVDGVGRNEMAAGFRGVVLNSSDNWSKVHFSSGDGWVQWSFGASNQVTPLLFVKEAVGENFSAAQASQFSQASPVPEPVSSLMFALGLGALVARSSRKKASPR